MDDTNLPCLLGRTRFPPGGGRILKIDQPITMFQGKGSRKGVPVCLMTI